MVARRVGDARRIGAAYLVHVGVVLLFLTGVGGLVALPVVTVLAGVGLGLCGFVGTGRRRAWWLGATALVLVPGALVTESSRGSSRRRVRCCSPRRRCRT